MTTQTEITVATAENALLAPLMAVSTDPEGKKTVRVLLDDGTVAVRAVTTGINDGVQVQIVSGLRAGEKVITGRMSREELQAQSQSRARRRGPF